MDKQPLYKLLLSIHNWKVQAINSIDAIYSYSQTSFSYMLLHSYQYYLISDWESNFNTYG